MDPKYVVDKITYIQYRKCATPSIPIYVDEDQICSRRLKSCCKIMLYSEYTCTRYSSTLTTPCSLPLVYTSGRPSLITFADITIHGSRYLEKSPVNSVDITLGYRYRNHGAMAVVESKPLFILKLMKYD
jgi:hypothetical protein